MPTIKVTKSPDINQLDKITYQGKKLAFSLDDKNTTDGSLILIYMYYLPKFPQHGIKVGMTTCGHSETFWHAVKSRITNQEHEVALSPEQYEKYGFERQVVYWGICLDARSDSFKDYAVHDEIKKRYAGITEKQQEWFTNVPVDELIKIFDSLRHRDENKEIYAPRKEQRECIDAIKAYFNDNPKGRFLLNCKMRFGKSFTTYKYCEEANLDKILILTFVPAVESSWKEDLCHIEKRYRYFTDDNLKRNDFVLNLVSDPYVVFLSLQNYLGKDKNADVKAKIAQLQDIDWDLVILDEYHFGAWNQRTQGTIKNKEENSEDLDPTYQAELKKTKDVLEKFKIRTQKTICLSGTPFKALAKGEFNGASSFTYSYFDEQRNKYPNSGDDDFSVVNPDYAQFPDMKIFGYNMSRLFGNMTASIFSDEKILGRKFFSLNKFFATRQESNPNEPCTFIYEDEVKDWLEIIKGKSVFGIDFPFSKKEMVNNNEHTLWLMPTIKSCQAMADLLSSDEFFSKYQIINLSQDGVGAGLDAFEYLQDQITAGENTGKLGSIAITVNKLTIGVTVKKWSSVFVLKDLASPEQYFQSIFRIQTPYKINGEIKKKEGYVYDFNIDRASALLLKYAEQSESDGQYTKLQVAELIVKYLPIFVNGDFSNKISAQVFFELAKDGDSSGIPLSRKIVDIEKTTRMLDEETVASMQTDPEVSPILKKVFAHAKFKKAKTGITPAKPDDGFDSKPAKEGRDIGYVKGQEDCRKYVDYDDISVQSEFERALKEYLQMYCPKEYAENEKQWFASGFEKGYKAGVNTPIKKERCGYDDGVKFVDEIKRKFGDKIQYTKSTRQQIDNFVNTYLNDINHIPTKYRGILYKKWYCESFKRAIKTALKPIDKNDDGNTIEDTENVIKHLLARLFEFLYISVYRETTFNEIFKNADPDIFLEAVGITKKEFEILNKYKVFQEDVLNNYIHEFFVNESLGSRINLEDENVKKQYRNSFDWFGFGLVGDEENNLENNAESFVVEQPFDSANHEEFASVQEGSTTDENQVIPEKTKSAESEVEAMDDSFDDSNREMPELLDRIKDLLRKEKRAKSSKIASELNVSKKEVNQILYANSDLFSKDILFNWRLR